MCSSDLFRNDTKYPAIIQGFTVTWQRLFYQGSEVVKRENYSWKYSAGDKITCAAPQG